MFFSTFACAGLIAAKLLSAATVFVTVDVIVVCFATNSFEPVTPSAALIVSAVTGAEGAGFEELDDEFLLVRTLTEARKEAGMTQQQLAEKSGVHQVNISRIENGTGNPSVETLQKLAKGMGKKLIIAFA